MRSIAVLTGIILAAIIVSTNIYALQNPRNGIIVTSPEEVALAYIREGPTFRFDGISSTLRVIKVDIRESYPLQYVVTIWFQSLHGGYGNRTGQILTQVITPHTAVVTVVNGKVLSAVLDVSWDEVAQRPIQDEDIRPVIEDTALSWLVNAPTFKFDGVAGSAKVTDSWLAMTFAAPSFWGVTIEFDCLHSGYGDRSGEMLAQVITHHVAMIHVTEGVVNFAIIDDVWDEVKQKFIETTYTVEMAEETALEWLNNCPTFRFDGIPETVKVKQIVPLRMLNAWDVYIGFTCNYPGYGDRTGNVMLGHSQTHLIQVTVIEGKVTRAIIDDRWDEMKQTMIDSCSSILSSEQARDIVVKYLIEKHGLDVEIPEVWMIEDLAPQLLGVEKTRYTSGDWVVIIEYAVVWKPVYTVTVEKGQDVSWKGKVDQSGAVTSD